VTTVNRFTGLGDRREIFIGKELSHERTRKSIAALSPSKQVEYIEERLREYWPALTESDNPPRRVREPATCEAISKEPKF